MKLPKPNNIQAEKYVAGMSLFKSKLAKIKLSANESALGPSPKAKKEYLKVSKSFARYPDSDGTFLRKTLSSKFKLDINRIILGSGSDQIFELICKSFLKKGDEVIVLSGKDKGKTGKIIRVFPKQMKATVSEINKVKKNQKPDNNQPGGITEKEMPIHISNLSLFDSALNKGVRIGFKINKDKKIRINKSSGKEI